MMLLLTFCCIFLIFITISYYVLLGYDMQCVAKLCYVLPLDVMLFEVMPCYAMQCYVVLCNAILC